METPTRFQSRQLRTDDTLTPVVDFFLRQFGQGWKGSQLRDRVARITWNADRILRQSPRPFQIAHQ